MYAEINLKELQDIKEAAKACRSSMKCVGLIVYNDVAFCALCEALGPED